MDRKTKIEKIVKRFQNIYVVSLLLVFVIFFRIISIQFFMDDPVTEEDIYKEDIIPAERGSILAKDGRPLAISVPAYEIRMDCSSPHDTIFYPNVKGLARSLSKLYKHKTPQAYEKDLKLAREKNNKYFRIGNRDISYMELQSLKAFPIFNKGKFQGGLIIIDKTKRENPYGSLALRTIGYVNRVGAGAGIEKSYNYKLEGTPGKQYISRQLGGQYIRVAGAPVTPAINGYDIRTTIDIDIQEAAEEALRSQLAQSDVFEGGTAIVMEVSTGAVRAIANMRKTKSGKFDESYNYAVGHATEPGSTLKLATLVALIEDGYVTLDTPIDGGDGIWMYKGTKFSDTRIGGYGMLTVKEAFAKSSNVCFAKLATEHYGNDEQTFVSRFTNMKIGERYNLEIEGEGRSAIYSPGDKNWSGVTLPMMGIGYGVLLTPLHTLTFYNAIANNGKMMKPYFIEDFEKDGLIDEKFSPQIISGAICSKNTAKEVKKALRYVVEKGTAAKYDDKRYQFSGKTGTAQIAENGRYVDANGYRRHQASFAGFFPSDDPKYSCIVVLYTGQTRKNFYGGTWATPVFKAIADKVYTSHPEWKEPLHGQGIQPQDNPSVAGGRADQIKTTLAQLPTKNEISLSESGWVKVTTDDNGYRTNKIGIEMGIMPDVVGMGLKDALYILENEGYSVSFNGTGRVIEQHPSPGDTIRTGTRTTLKLGGKR